MYYHFDMCTPPVLAACPVFDARSPSLERPLIYATGPFTIHGAFYDPFRVRCVLGPWLNRGANTQRTQERTVSSLMESLL